MFAFVKLENLEDENYVFFSLRKKNNCEVEVKKIK